MLEDRRLGQSAGRSHARPAAQDRAPRQALRPVEQVSRDRIRQLHLGASWSSKGTSSGAATVARSNSAGLPERWSFFRTSAPSHALKVHLAPSPCKAVFWYPSGRSRGQSSVVKLQFIAVYCDCENSGEREYHIISSSEDTIFKKQLQPSKFEDPLASFNNSQSGRISTSK